ncbi:Ankyrin repeat protein [Rutstroemia sp. NJR-2017a BVV2]|nr:Ankyrin repeat protein [Rutstroemia sp. NJR-2017a BVV2]
MLDQNHENLPRTQTNDNNSYCLGSMCNHSIVVVCLPSMGTNSAAACITQMVNTFPSLRACAIVGIGGGVPPEVRLGDVVISTSKGSTAAVVQSDMGKLKDTLLESTSLMNNPSTLLLTASKTMMAKHEQLETLPHLRPGYLKTDSFQDVLYISSYAHVEDDSKTNQCNGDESDGKIDNCHRCDKSKTVLREPRDMCVHYGPIASGNQVIKSAIWRDHINKQLGGNILCFGMEAAGLMNNFPCIVIRGICDYADSHKNDGWQRDAAAVAAAVFKELLSYVQPEELRQQPKMKDTVTDIYDNIKSMEFKISTKEDLRVLNWLTPISFGAQQSAAIDLREPYTGTWFLESEVVKHWVKTEKTTLFCRGMPGAGKSMITAIMVDDLNARFQHEKDFGIAHIYCDYGKKKDQTVNAFLASLLRQLCKGCTNVPDSVRTLYQRHQKNETRPTLDELSNCLQSVVALYSRVFIIVDALDEFQDMNNDRSKFISVILKLQTQCKVNLFATSRDLPEITSMFDGSLTMEIRAQDEDIPRYIDGQISRLPKFVSKQPDLKTEVKDKIVEAVQGMFLLAKFHLESLRGMRSPKAMKTALMKLPTGYDVAYKSTMERVHSQEKQQVELAKDVLSWIATFHYRASTRLSCRSRRLDLYEFFSYTCCNWGYHVQAASLSSSDHEVMRFLKKKANLEAASQVLQVEHFWNINGIDDYASNATGLHLIAYFGIDNVMKDLIGDDGPYSKNVDPRTSLGETPLVWAVRSHRETAVRLLVGKGACVEAKMHASDNTILFYAIDFRNLEIAKILIEKNADMNVSDELDGCLLFTAMSNNDEEAVELLLDSGCDIEQNEWCDKSPLFFAIQSEMESMVKLLLRKGANIEGTASRGSTPLIYATIVSNEDVVKILLNKGANIEARDVGCVAQRTPLLWAVELGNYTLTKLLVDSGANIEATDNFIHRTPLSFAAEDGHTAIVKLLIRKNADVRCYDDKNHLPTAYAGRSKHYTIVYLIGRRRKELEEAEYKEGMGGSDEEADLSWEGSDVENEEGVGVNDSEEDDDVEMEGSVSDGKNEEGIMMEGSDGENEEDVEVMAGSDEDDKVDMEENDEDDDLDAEGMLAVEFMKRMYAIIG